MDKQNQEQTQIIIPKMKFEFNPDDWEDSQQADVKLCKVQDPDCEACQ